MALIYDGSRAFTAVTNTAVSSSNHNQLQDLLILGLEERTISLDIRLAKGDESSTTWEYVPFVTSDPPYWKHDDAPSNEEIILPLPYLPSDTRITELNVVVNGNELSGDADPGKIGLYRQQLSTTIYGLSLVQGLGGATPWRLVNTVTKHSSTGLSIDVAAEYYYFLLFQAPDAAADRACKVYSAWMKAQFHKGT